MVRISIIFLNFLPNRKESTDERIQPSASATEIAESLNRSLNRSAAESSSSSISGDPLPPPPSIEKQKLGLLLIIQQKDGEKRGKWKLDRATAFFGACQFKFVRGKMIKTLSKYIFSQKYG